MLQNLLIIPVILGVSFIIFLIMNLRQVTCDDTAARLSRNNMRAGEMGLNGPFFVRYFGMFKYEGD